MGLSLLTIFAACAAYPFALINSAGVIAYFILSPDPLPETAPLPDEVVDEEPLEETPSEQDDLFSDPDDEPF